MEEMSKLIDACGSIAGSSSSEYFNKSLNFSKNFSINKFNTYYSISLNMTAFQHHINDNENYYKITIHSRMPILDKDIRYTGININSEVEKILAILGNLQTVSSIGQKELLLFVNDPSFEGLKFSRLEDAIIRNIKYEEFPKFIKFELHSMITEILSLGELL